MGYIIEVNRCGHRDILSTSETRCSLCLDQRGIPILYPPSYRSFLKLFELQQGEGLDSGLKVACSELAQRDGISLSENLNIPFSGKLELKWRDINFKIITISSKSFFFSKTRKKDELSTATSRFSLECAELNLKLPLSTNTILTIGSHKYDSITVSNEGVKPKHAKIILGRDASTLEILALLGPVETRVEKGVSVFRLAPSKLEFQIKESFGS